MILRMNAKEFAAYHSKLVDNLRPTLLRGVRAGGQRAIQYLIERTRTAPPANPSGTGSGGAVNTGEFIRGWSAVNIDNGVSIIQKKGYGPIVEHGRRPGSFPPKQAIIEWAMRRLGLSADDAARAAFPIQRAIARRGLIGRKILTADEAQTRILYLVREETIRELELELRRK